MSSTASEINAAVVSTETVHDFIISKSAHLLSLPEDVTTRNGTRGRGRAKKHDTSSSVTHESKRPSPISSSTYSARKRSSSTAESSPPSKRNRQSSDGSPSGDTQTSDIENRRGVLEEKLETAELLHIHALKTLTDYKTFLDQITAAKTAIVQRLDALNSGESKSADAEEEREEQQVVAPPAAVEAEVKTMDVDDKVVRDSAASDSVRVDDIEIVNLLDAISLHLYHPESSTYKTAPNLRARLTIIFDAIEACRQSCKDYMNAIYNKGKPIEITTTLDAAIAHAHFLERLMTANLFGLETKIHARLLRNYPDVFHSIYAYGKSLRRILSKRDEHVDRPPSAFVALDGMRRLVVDLQSDVLNGRKDLADNTPILYP